MKLANRLAVCSWSLQPKTPEQLLANLKTIGIPQVQLALDPIRSDPKTWGKVADLLRQNDIQIVSGMLATVGEDYTTMETIRKSGGIVPDEHWEQNKRNIKQIATIASDLRLLLVTFHAGFLPHDENDPGFAKLRDRLREVADIFAEKKIGLGLETGQETGETLATFLRKLDRGNVGVNFDPANMILYDQSDPIAALGLLAPWLRQVHIKDAKRTKKGGTWGEEVVVGRGEVDWKKFFAVLDEEKFDGYCCIEREAGNQRVHDIRAAREFVEKIK
ncbi:MAG TPA: sugar phosphate isomerase/epimerase family protein [Verrucomicrobiae bacterium]|nr:sugar phosphate isomerase/epimerase family protein [Verrucomicrobiae bacterium]